MAKSLPTIGQHSQRGAFQKLDGRGEVARRLRAIMPKVTEALRDWWPDHPSNESVAQAFGRA